MTFAYRPRNFRDIGGEQGSRGRIRPNLLFRSAQLDTLSPEEVNLLRPLGLTLALDLRNKNEKAPAEKRASALLPEIRQVHVPLMENLSPAEIAALMEQVKHIHTRRELRKLMAMQYFTIMTRGRSRVIAALKTVMAHDGPLVFFCVAGKDRTGILAMMLELTLGLTPRAVLRDYHQTNDYYFGLPFWRKPTDRARSQYAGSSMALWMIDTLSEAHTVFLAAALKPLRDAGGIDAWLTGPDGLDPVLIADFRARMLEP